MEKTQRKINEILPHIAEIRKRLIFTLLFFGIFLLLSFVFSNNIFGLILNPIKGFDVRLIYIAPQEGFFSLISLSFKSAILFTIPFAILQIYLFVKPALSPFESNIATRILFISFVLFLIAIFISYRFIIPFAFKFFISFDGIVDRVSRAWSVIKYINVYFMIMFASIFVMQIPLVLFGLIKIGILNTAILSRFRPHIIIAVFTISAIITPPDIYTQIIMGTLLYILFELTIFIARK